MTIRPLNRPELLSFDAIFPLRASAGCAESSAPLQSRSCRAYQVCWNSASRRAEDRPRQAQGASPPALRSSLGGPPDEGAGPRLCCSSRTVRTMDRRAAANPLARGRPRRPAPRFTGLAHRKGAPYEPSAPHTSRPPLTQVSATKHRVVIRPILESGTDTRRWIWNFARMRIPGCSHTSAVAK